MALNGSQVLTQPKLKGNTNDLIGLSESKQIWITHKPNLTTGRSRSDFLIIIIHKWHFPVPSIIKARDSKSAYLKHAGVINDRLEGLIASGEKAWIIIEGIVH